MMNWHDNGILVENLLQNGNSEIWEEHWRTKI